MKKCKRKRDREEILRIIGLYKNEFTDRFGVTRLGVFGSVARGETAEPGDVDIVVELQKPDLFYLVHIKEELEKALHCPVDIVHYRKHMNDFLKKRIERDVVYV